MTNLIRPTRRTVLQGAAAGGALLAAPKILRAASHTKYVRASMTSDEGKANLDIYRKAVANMWALPPDDPHNWFRVAMIHLMDCPHGNWWFFSWHRGYVGNFEQIIRIHGEDDSFALPYWDWSADPFVADTMFQGDAYPDNALDPTSSHFPQDWDSFENAFHDTVEKFWAGLSDPQRDQEKLRGFPDFDTFWTDGVKANFTTPPSLGRSKTPAAPDLTDPAASQVKPAIILSGLKTVLFTTVVGEQKSTLGFNSPESANHHMGVGSAIIEGQPHNKVHNNLGDISKEDNVGWMPSLLSSVDPIFFLHHCNVDRLWDVWTRKQMNLPGGSWLPTDEEAKTFYPEPFLFYVNADRQPAPGVAKDFMDVAPWGYSYTDGTGSEIVGQPLIAAATTPSATAMAAPNAMFAIGQGAATRLALPDDLAAAAAADEPRQIAHITFVPPQSLKGVSFDVFITPRTMVPEIAKDSPDFAGSFEFFGMPMGHGTPFTASVDVTDALDRLHASGALAPGAEIDVTLVAATPDGEPIVKNGAPVEGTLQSVTIEAI